MRWGLEAWALWVLAGAIGGAVGGASSLLQFFGPLFLWGAALGAAQALVLLRYLPLFVAGAWMGASFIGWIAGWMVFFVTRVALTTLVPEIDRQWGPELAVFVVWMVFAAFQGTTLALVVLALGRRTLLPLAALWVPAGISGGALAVTTSSYLSNATALSLGGGDGYLGQIVPGIVVGQTVAGTLYSAATGVVLAVIVWKVD